MALVDDQHGLWSNFYVGNNALALQEANGQNGFVIRAEFCEKNQNQTPDKLGQLADALVQATNDNQDPHVVAVQSATKAIQDSSREAIEWSRTAASPELIAQRVQFHLMWNRVDLAQRELDELRKLVGDEDNALVQRASCMVRLAIGDAPEARDICSDLIDKFTASPALLVGRAVAQMQSGEWDSAASDLQQTAPSGLYSAEVKLNTVCCSARLKQDEFSDQLNEFKSQFPNHPAVAKLKEAALAFKEFA